MLHDKSWGEYLANSEKHNIHVRTLSEDERKLPINFERTMLSYEAVLNIIIKFDDE